MSFARSACVRRGQGPDWNALRAALTARSMSAASPAAAREPRAGRGVQHVERLAGLRGGPTAVDEQLVVAREKARAQRFEARIQGRHGAHREPPVEPALLSCTARMELGVRRGVQMVVFYNTHWDRSQRPEIMAAISDRINRRLNG